jgi:hypothetical protein
MAGPTILCPSWQCEKGATLLGIVLMDGSVAFAKDQIVIDQQFVDAAQEGRSPEKRFRFSSTCRQGGCIQWQGDRCGIIDQILEEQTSAEGVAELPPCTIRARCRWYVQRGEAACFACPEVVTDLEPERQTV